MSEPLVDILLATYNGSRFVGEQIESIRRQTYINWRLLVSDDCSTDGTLDVVKQFARTDSRIQIVSEGIKHGGAKENFFSLMRHSDSRYCMFCDQDDVWLPGKIANTFDLMRRLEGEHRDVPLLVFTDMKVVDGNLTTIHESFECFSSIDPSRSRFPQVIAQSLGAGCTMMVNAETRDISLKIGSTDDVIMHDWWITLVAAAFGHIAYLDEATSLYRQHGMNELGAVEYSPLKRASHFNQMTESVASTIRQARAFRDCYRDSLDLDKIESVDEFVAMGNTSGMSSVVHLLRSRCWKKGLRKVGQALVAAKGSEVKRKWGR